MADPKLDIFEAMSAVDLRDGGWLARQPEASRKTLAPPVFLRWASAVSDGAQSAALLLRVNERVNRSMWDLATEHPELVFRLAASCGTGRRERHQWVPMPKRAGAANKARAMVEAEHPGANGIEVDLLLSMHTRASFAQWVDGRGLPPAEVKEALKAYDRIFPRNADKDAVTAKGKARGRGDAT